MTKHAEAIKITYVPKVITYSQHLQIFFLAHDPTTLEPLAGFYVAEDYHQNYVANNPTQGYVRACALPKMDKVSKAYKAWLKTDEDRKAEKK